MFKSQGQLTDVIVAVDPMDLMGADVDNDFEMIEATEDDIIDDCPLCQQLRERIQRGEKVQVVKLKGSRPAMH